MGSINEDAIMVKKKITMLDEKHEWAISFFLFIPCCRTTANQIFILPSCMAKHCASTLITFKYKKL